MGQRLLTASEAAQIAGVSRTAVNNWMRAGLIPGGERRGLWWFVDPAALDVFLRNRRRRVSSKPFGDKQHVDTTSGYHAAA